MTAELTSIEQSNVIKQNDSIIEIHNLWKVYFPNTPAEVKALRGVSLTINRGDFISLMGPSGSGKSTLLTIIGCMARPTNGKVILDGVNVVDLPQTQLSTIRKQKIGFVFQEMYLINTLTALENVLLPLIPYGITNSDKERALELLKIAGLEHRVHHKPTELSGGERQRVAICRALINNAPILLADEPTGNLDSETGREILNLFKRINEEQGITIIIATHDPQVQKYTHKTLMMKDGQVYFYEKNHN